MSARYMDEKRQQLYDPAAQHIEMGGCEDASVMYSRRRTPVVDQMLRSCRKTAAGSRLIDLFKALCFMAVGALMILSFTDSAQPSSMSSRPPPPTTTRVVKVAIPAPASSRLAHDQVLAGDKKAKIGQVTFKFASGTGASAAQVSGDAGDVDKLYERSLALMEQYAGKWGYPLWVGKQELLKGPEAGGLSGLWSKHALTLSILLDELRKPAESRLQWLFFTDADTVFANHNVPLETFLPPDTRFGRSQSLLCSMDQTHTLNSGAIMVRVSQDGLRLLTTLLSYPFSQEGGASRMDMGEQMALTSLLKNDRLRKKIAIVPAHWINADAIALQTANAPDKAEAYQYGDLLAHFTTPVKAGWRELLDVAARGDEEAMTLPLEKTRYMLETKHDQTVSHFWDTWDRMGSEERSKKINDASHGGSQQTSEVLG